ncbi:hypothetical protein SLAV_35340 [Streptomyces lavendulae subsp. lavendulae]|uniref:Uncharacterized protein n=2 Tax=Streptomyces lavendulae TaxID=1914 RepID=A0A2K8PQW9_STRLA|nr:hypothetical protein [Streptomyces lavendulae]ATZ28838.1 hypothetical protein SLAV_35340 [Streptomyces lavendulae subsp. lavendulae]QUQ58663.1 hypothetical protein SLLC_33515 [Streptomyces lavendulae subsp. lavendulae]GLW01664.1 hypothetical protein Slala05_52950 [Streptomyces lavendulae subsp. lavendulae]
MTMLPASRVAGRTWTVRLTGHADHTVSVTCSTGACRMPPRSKDTVAMRRFAAEHIRAHARLATVRPNAACACRAADCSYHEDSRASCTGTPLLVLIHNPAVGQVWTLAEICQACARLIHHITVLGRAQGAAPAPRTQPAAETAPARVAVAGGFSSPEAAPEAVPRRRPHRGGPRRAR